MRSEALSYDQRVDEFGQLLDQAVLLGLDLKCYRTGKHIPSGCAYCRYPAAVLWYLLHAGVGVYPLGDGVFEGYTAPDNVVKAEDPALAGLRAFVRMDRSDTVE